MHISKKGTTDVHFVNNIFIVAFTQFGRGTIYSRKHTDHSKTKDFLANIATNSVAIETAQLVKLSIEFHLKYGGKNNHKKIVRIFASHVTLNLTTNGCHGFKMFNNFFLAKKTEHELKTLHFSRYSCLFIVHTSYAKSSTFSLQTIQFEEPSLRLGNHGEHPPGFPSNSQQQQHPF